MFRLHLSKFESINNQKKVNVFQDVTKQHDIEKLNNNIIRTSNLFDDIRTDNFGTNDSN